MERNECTLYLTLARHLLGVTHMASVAVNFLGNPNIEIDEDNADRKNNHDCREGIGNEARRKERTPADEKKREIAYNMTYYANPSVLQVKSDRLKPRRK